MAKKLYRTGKKMGRNAGLSHSVFVGETEINTEMLSNNEARERGYAPDENNSTYYNGQMFLKGYTPALKLEVPESADEDEDGLSKAELKRTEDYRRHMVQKLMDDLIQASQRMEEDIGDKFGKILYGLIAGEVMLAIVLMGVFYYVFQIAQAGGVL